MPKISVIVPIYKVEKYLNKCIDSILNQTFADFELILIDDGSPDNCGRICDEYVDKDKRIKVIHKENGGLADARNTGINIAKGEYIMFIDSDDYIDVKTLETLYLTLINNNADMSVCDFYYIDEENNVIEEKNKQSTCPNEVFTKEQYFYNMNSIPFVTVTNKLYKLSIWNNLRFPKNKLHEDEFVIHKIVDKCHYIAFTSKKMYYYVQRSSSIMNDKYNIKRLDGAEALLDRIKYFLDNNLNTLVGRYVLMFIHIYNTGYAKLDLKNTNNKEKLKNLKKESDKIYFRAILKIESLKIKIIYTMFTIHPIIYIKWLSIRKNIVKYCKSNHFYRRIKEWKRK